MTNIKVKKSPGPVIAAALLAAGGVMIISFFIMGLLAPPAALRQMRFQRRFVLQEQIQRAIEPILVDLVLVELQQVAKGSAAKPILGDVQFAGWLA